ncbi:ankyrin repeat domain-containing protein [Endozoicomonas sp. SCSIO W0465]|uniref:ankyrin repeat domain-containing protein n=1 Tax=Endozoicomonas sp. SCSIO W0465 TaxID=2918516 RepID=UPI002074E54C|nr:ankyrin repeat domain-containing protein [Endozoicomonas sp. SCSIO W0465]USE37831.1 ankyrin repeat domain-containing protein [Endozoicomonas sp. SCSIO W0465]
MPLVNENTGESYPDEFFPDQAFFYACSHGNLAFVRSRLLKGGGSVNGVVNNNGFTALMLAAVSGQLAVVKLLIDKGAEVSAVNNNGFTTLMLAARSGQLAVVKLLIDKGAEVSAVNNNGFTARMLAQQDCHLDVVEFLLDKESKDNNHKTNLTLTRHRQIMHKPDQAGRLPIATFRQRAMQTGDPQAGRVIRNLETDFTLARHWEIMRRLDQAVHLPIQIRWLR